MKAFSVGGVLAMTLSLGAAPAKGQSANGAIEAHITAAKTAAGGEWAGLFNRVCAEAVPPPAMASDR